MLFFEKLMTIRRRIKEEKRQREEREQKWRDEWNEFYKIGDLVSHAIKISKNAIGNEALGLAEKHDKTDVLHLFEGELTLNVDERLSLKLKTCWDSERAKKLHRTEKLLTEFNAFPEVLSAITFFIDGMAIDYDEEKYTKLSMVVLDFLEKRVKEVSEKKKNLVEDYLKQQDVSC